MVNVAVIGPRFLPGPRWLENAIDSVLSQLEKWNLSVSDVTLVSGGCSYSDHVAVLLYLKYPFKGLVVHLPSERYMRTLRKLQAVYDERNGRSHVEEYKEAIQKGARLVRGGTFHGRNNRIANNSDYLICLSSGLVRKHRGSYYTWNLFSHSPSRRADV